MTRRTLAAQHRKNASGLESPPVPPIAERGFGLKTPAGLACYVLILHNMKVENTTRVSQ